MRASGLGAVRCDSSYCPAAASIGALPPSIAGRTPQVPGVPLARLRPAQTSPVEQVPLPPMPQQGWLSAPQVAHWLAVAASTHSCGDVQALAPPSRTGPPVVWQQT
jgi:hypothetical protein